MSSLRCVRCLSLLDFAVPCNVAGVQIHYLGQQWVLRCIAGGSVRFEPHVSAAALLWRLSSLHTPCVSLSYSTTVTWMCSTTHLTAASRLISSTWQAWSTSTSPKISSELCFLTPSPIYPRSSMAAAIVTTHFPCVCLAAVCSGLSALWTTVWK